MIRRWSHTVIRWVYRVDNAIRELAWDGAFWLGLIGLLGSVYWVATTFR